MRDATTEYKESLKSIDPNFDFDYYDRLILGDLQTPAFEDPVGFDQLNLIGTLGTTAGPSTDQDAAPVEKPAKPLADQDAASVKRPTEPPANQDVAPVTSQPTVPAVDQPTDLPAA